MKGSLSYCAEACHLVWPPLGVERFCRGWVIISKPLEWSNGFFLIHRKDDEAVSSRPTLALLYSGQWHSAW